MGARGKGQAGRGGAAGKRRQPAAKAAAAAPARASARPLAALAARATAADDSDRRKRPKVVPLTQPAIASFSDWDKVGQIRNVLRAFESSSGYDAAAIFADAMLRDDRLHGVLDTRASGLTGTPVDVAGADSKRRSVRIAEELGGSDEEPGLWETFFPAATLADVWLNGYMLGIGVAEIVWRTDGGRWLPTLRPWHSSLVRWNEQEQSFYVRTANEGEARLPNIDKDPQGDGRWFVWCPYGYRNAWRRAAVRPLAMLYLARQWAYRDWSRYNEKHGNPSDKLKYPTGASEDEINGALEMLANRAGDGAIMLPQGQASDLPGWDVTLLEATGQSHDSFEKQIIRCETNMAVLVLGQNLTSEVQGGSLAAASVHDNVRLDKKREDAKIAPQLRAQVLTYWAAYNYGDPALAPVPSYSVDPPADELAAVQVLAGVGDAILALQAAGLDVDVEAIAERFGVPFTPEDLASVDEVDVDPAAPADGTASKPQLTPSAVGAIISVNEARASQGYGPLMQADGTTPDPDGNLSITAFQAKNAAEIAAAANAEAGRDPGAEPKPDAEPKPRPGAGRQEALRAIAMLSRRLSERPKAKKGDYAEAVVASARKRAARALSVDLVELRHVIDQATDPRDLRRRLVALYRDRMKSHELEKVVSRANILASLAGRGSAIEDL